VHHADAFLYISLPLLHDYNVTLPNFTLYEGREHETTIFFFFLWTSIQSFRIQLQKNSPTLFWQIEQDGIRAKKFEAVRIHFLYDVFTAIAVVDAKAP